MTSTAAVPLLALALALAPGGPPADQPARLVRSAHDGRWSDPSTWAGGRLPGGGDRVQIREGHVVVFDALVDDAVRSIHVAGTLTFDPGRDTRLTVGLIKIQAGDDASESGFNCEAHAPPPMHPGARPPALLLGTAEHPVDADHSAILRLAPVRGLDPDECPALVCCGGRMEFHGAPLSRTWVKLGADAAAGDASVALDGPVTGWRVGDLVVVTATRRQVVKDDVPVPSVATGSTTEERRIKAVGPARLVLDMPLRFAHRGSGDFRGEVANLSRNVVVESADPSAARGHTMYHRNSSGAIAYAEFRHLGKSGVLGKYSLHFHRCGDTMRGTSVVGASVWDSHNRWVTVHGTNRLVVKDCVGYGSRGHGFFLEDGTEVDNIFDRNLAVQAFAATPLPGQVMGFDRNEGAGFWWANSRNAFVRNVAVDCDEYGFRYDARAADGFDPVLNVRGSAGGTERVDIRTLPFLRFEDNEAHAQRRYGVNLGGGHGSGADSDGVGGVGPDSRHPFVVKDLKVWDAHWAFTPAAPGLLVDGFTAFESDFGLWRPRYDRQAYRRLTYRRTEWSSYLESGKRPDVEGYPAPLAPVDDRPPVSVITEAVMLPKPAGRLRVRGASADDGRVAGVRVNGRAVTALVHDFSYWEIYFDPSDAGGVPAAVTAVAEDAQGHFEADPHRRVVTAP